jgi:hypothetical protein
MATYLHVLPTHPTQPNPTQPLNQPKINTSPSVRDLLELHQTG